MRSAATQAIEEDDEKTLATERLMWQNKAKRFWKDDAQQLSSDVQKIPVRYRKKAYEWLLCLCNVLKVMVGIDVLRAQFMFIEPPAWNLLAAANAGC